MTSQAATTGTCQICGETQKKTQAGVLRAHGPASDRCIGAGHLPLETTNRIDIIEQEIERLLTEQRQRGLSESQIVRKNTLIERRDAWKANRAAERKACARSMFVRDLESKIAKHTEKVEQFLAKVQTGDLLYMARWGEMTAAAVSQSNQRELQRLLDEFNSTDHETEDARFAECLKWVTSAKRNLTFKCVRFAEDPRNEPEEAKAAAKLLEDLDWLGSWLEEAQ